MTHTTSVAQIATLIIFFVLIPLAACLALEIRAELRK